MEPDLVGKRVIELGSRVFHYLLEVFPLRSTSTGKRKPADLFPLPTSKGSLGKTLPDFDDLSLAWMQSACVSLNSLWGDCLLYDGEASKKEAARSAGDIGGLLVVRVLHDKGYRL